MSDASYAVLTRAKAKYGKRLKESDYNSLLDCRDISEVMTYLKTNTHYTNAFGEANERDIHRGVFENLLIQYYNYEFDTLSRYELSVGESFSEFIRHQTEIREVVRFLTLLNASDKKHFHFTFPAHLEKHTSINLNLLTNATNYNEFMEAIKNTKYEKVLKEFVITEGKTIPIADIEDKLNILNYTELYNSISELQGTDADELRDFFDCIIDYNNFTRIIRLKKFYNYDLEFVKKHLLPFGTLTENKVVELYNAVNTGKFEEIVSKTKHGNMLNKIEDGTPDKIINKIKFKKAKHSMYFSNSPAIVMISYITLLEIELQNLIYIIEGVRYNVDKNEIKSLLLY